MIDYWIFIDILGLRQLKIIRLCLENIEKNILIQREYILRQIKISMKNRMSKEEYRNEINRVHRPSGSSIHKSDKEADFERVYDEAVQALRYIQGFMRDDSHEGDVGIKITLPVGSRGDIDNLAKGIIDSLQGIVYKNDKQVQKLIVHRNKDRFAGL